MSGARGLVVDLAAAQAAAGGAGGDAESTAGAGEQIAALLARPGLVRALLLDPAQTLPGGLHPALLSSPLLRWNTATEVRRVMREGPVAYLVPAGGGRAVLPPIVAERAVPLVVLVGDDASARSEELVHHADLVLFTDGAAAAQALGIEASRLRRLVGDDIAAAVADAVQALDAPPLSRLSGRPPRMHVALVGAMPPSTAPSAVANARLAEALAARCHLDVAGAGEPDRAWLDRLGARHFSVDALARHGLAASYDAVVHVVGGAADDLPALRSARHLPGVLWLHDIALAEPHRHEAALGDAPAAALSALLRRVYAERAPLPVLERLDAGDAPAFDTAAERRFGLLLTGEVVRSARAVVVGDAAAARRVRLDQGASAPCPPIAVVDPGDPDAAAGSLLRLIAALQGGDIADVAVA